MQQVRRQPAKIWRQLAKIRRQPATSDEIESREPDLEIAALGASAGGLQLT